VYSWICQVFDKETGVEWIACDSVSPVISSQIENWFGCPSRHSTFWTYIP